MVIFERSFIALRFWLIKLGLAVLLALAAARLLGIQDRLSPTFTALLCIKGTFFTGVAIGKKQVTAALLGSALALLSSLLFGTNDLTLAVAVMIAAYVCIWLNWESSTLLVLFTLLYSFLLPIGTLTQTAETRIEGVFVGVAVATVINYLFSHFRYRRMYYFRLRHAMESLETAVRRVLDSGRAASIEELTSQAAEVKSLAKTVSLLYEESVDLAREASYRRLPGDLDEVLIPRIEALAVHLESSCWHLFGVTEAMVELLGAGEPIPVSALEHLARVSATASETVQAFQEDAPDLNPPQLPSGELRLPFFGMPLPQVTLSAELALLTADVAQIRFNTVRFLIEFGEAEEASGGTSETR